MKKKLFHMQKPCKTVQKTNMSKPNHIPDLDFRAGHLVLGPALDVAQSNLCHFGVRVGEVRRHLRGSVLPSVDLAQDVGQHEVPAGPLRLLCGATWPP